MIVGAMLVLAIIGPWIAPDHPGVWAGRPFEPPSRSHWFGTDDMGQDLWSAWLYGARHSVFVSVLAALGATALGTLAGAGAGYRRGGWDFAAMRLVDFLLTLPMLPLVLVVAFYAGASAGLLIAVLILTLWARCARELHPAAAALRDADFVVAERAMGASERSIVARHIIPVLSPMILAQFARLTHQAVLLESSLSFLGLGDPRWASWGRTLYYANARGAFLGDAWLWWAVPPGAGIALLITGFALLGVGNPRGAALRAAMNPHGPCPPADHDRLLQVRDLHVGYAGHAVLRGFELDLNEGEVVGLAGLSGSGKTTLVGTILGLLPQAEISRGAVWLRGRELLRLTERERRRLRGREVAWIPQAAMQSLNPVRTVGSQLREVARSANIAEALEQVGLPPEVEDAYPHQLSGGMRQRVVIAMVLCREPCVVLADEPTSGLDSERATEILTLLIRRCRERRMALLLISHDAGLLERHCDRLITLGPMPPIPRLAARSPVDRQAAVLEMSAVDFAYSNGAGVREISLRVCAGESVGLVGPSGAGKTTIARLAMHLLRPSRGRVRLLEAAHLIFQDPFSALPWHQRVKSIVAEPLRIAGASRAQRETAALAALVEAGLPDMYAERNVDTLSGGERQRVALARALIAHPRLIIADEPTSMLDAPAKWAWLERLDALRRDHNLAVLLITHDAAQANAFCDRIVRVEEGRTRGCSS